MSEVIFFPIVSERTPQKPEEIDVRGIRKSLGMTQQQFADRFGFRVNAIRRYEQGMRHPIGSVRTLLFLISRIPDIVESVLGEH